MLKRIIVAMSAPICPCKGTTMFLGIANAELVIGCKRCYQSIKVPAGNLDLFFKLEGSPDTKTPSHSEDRDIVEETRRRLVDAQALILSQTGEVEGLMACWISEIRPAAEILFGDLTNRDIGSTKDYTPTLFVGVYARTRICLLTRFLDQLCHWT